MSNKEKIKEQEEIIEIKGMRCKSCVEKIEGKLSQLKGVNKARVSIVDEKAYVRFDPMQIDLNTIKTEIEKLGYKTDLGLKDEKSAMKHGTKEGLIHGIIPGLMAHSCCIGFIIASILGATVATQILKPLLLNPYFFHILVALSFIFATISAIFYLKRQGFISINKGNGGLELSFSPAGIKRKWRYLSTLYGTTIGINLLFFMIIFPVLANVSASPTGAFVGVNSNGDDGISSIRLKVAIPCPGHAPLIIQELRSINGVVEAKFSFPNIFDVKYDSTITSTQQILSLEVFKTYKATVLDEQNSNNLQNGNSADGRVAVASVGGTCGAACGAGVNGGCACCGGLIG